MTEHPLHLLVVDDDERIRGLLQKFLIRNGFLVTAARDAAQARRLLGGLEFDLLVALARKPRQVFTRDVLLEQVWGYRHPADTRLVNVHVQRLRAKVERDPENPQVVLTVRGVGYKAGPP